NLLPGILALREGLIDAPTFLAAFDAWCHDPTRSLGQLLWESRDLTAGDRDRLLATAVGHALLRGNDHRPSPAPVETDTGVGRETQGSEPTDVAETVAFLARASEPIGHTGDPGPDESMSPTAGPSSRFEILASHAEGGLGLVYRAVDQELGRE